MAVGPSTIIMLYVKDYNVEQGDSGERETLERVQNRDLVLH